MELKRVVVTGLGAITPLGNTIDELFDNFTKGTSGCELITRFDTTNHKTKFACQVKEFDITKYIDKKEARKMDLFTQFGLASAAEAVVDGKLDLENLDLDRLGVVWGSGIGGLETLQNDLSEFGTNGRIPRFNPFFIPKIIGNIVAGHISMKFGLRGPSYGIVSACASASHALIDAFNLIRLNKADLFIAGGSEACICESGIGGFNVMHALSTNNDEYKSASRPFDLTRDGFVMGEGGCALILEEYEHAIKRGAKIYAEVVGGGMSSDAHHLTAPHPEGIGAMNTMKNAVDEAGLKLTDIDYINVHGTSTPLGDIAESGAIVKLFGDHAYKLNISSTKSMTGHLLGAAGAVEAMAAILSLTRDIIPPTINFKTPDPNIDSKLNLTLNEAQSRKVNYALSNTFGFGGHNASIVLKRFE
jgi:3-oxoacyl-[acyl-carrier-protein] synthase II